MATALINGIPQNRIGNRNGVDSLDVGRINDKRLDVGCMEFDGSGDGMGIKIAGVDPTAFTTISVSAWVKIAAQSNWGTIAMQSDSNDFDDGWGLNFYSGEDNLQFWIQAHTKAETAVADVSAHYGKWLHVVGTYDGTDQKLYFNGVEVASVADSWTAKGAATNEIHVGAGIGSSNTALKYGLDGKISDVAIWKRALSASEVATLYGASSQLELQSDGSNEYVDTGILPDVTTKISSAKWVTADSIAGSHNTGAHNSRRFYYGIYGGYAEAGVGEVNNLGSDSGKVSLSDAGIANGDWFHLAVVADAGDGGTLNGTAKVYVNGVEDSSFTYTGSAANSPDTNFLIGARSGGSIDHYWDGKIGQVALWDVALTADQIRMLYDQGLSGDWRTVARSGMVGYWPVNSNDGYGSLLDQKDGHSLGSNLVSSWDDPSYAYEIAFTTSGVNITRAAQDASSSFGIAVATIASPVVGKLYEISFTITLASGTMPFVHTGTADGYSNGTVSETPTAGANTIVFEATANDVVIQFWTGSGVATDFEVSNFTLKEVLNAGNYGTMVNAESTDLTVATSGGRAADPTVTQYVGGELVVNGDFSTALGSEWVAASSATLSLDTGRLKVANPSGANHGDARQTVTATPSKTYLVSVGGEIGDGANYQIKIGSTTGGSDLYSSGDVTTNGTTNKLVTVPSDQSAISVRLQNSGGNGTYCFFDNISVREVNYANTDLVMYNRLGDGGVAKALGFDGTEMVHIGTTTNYGAQATVSAWIKFDHLNAAGSNREGIIGSDYWAADNFSFHLHDDHTLFFGTGDNIYSKWAMAGHSSGDATHITVDTWHHLSLVYDSTETTNDDRARLYVDGVLKTATTVGGTYSGDLKSVGYGSGDGVGLKIGHAGQHKHVGEIKDVAIFSTALPASEIARIHAAGRDANVREVAKFKQLDFDSGDDYVDCGNGTSLQITNNITVAVWFKTDSDAYIVSKYAGTDNQRAWYLSILAGGELHAYIDAGGNYNPYETLKSTATYNDGNWHLGVFTFASGDLKIYADGVSVGVTSAGGSPTTILNSSASVLLNGVSGVGGQGTDSMSQASIWSRVLTASEISAMFDAGINADWRDGYADDMAGYWRMGDGASGYPIILDEKVPVQLGNELIDNGHFTSDLSGWTPAYGGQSGTISSVGGELKFAQATSALMSCKQGFQTVSGKTYKLTFNHKTMSSANYCKVTVGSSSSAVGDLHDDGYVTSATGATAVYFKATTSESFVMVWDVQTGWTTSTWDDFSVAEFTTGNHGTMTSMEAADITSPLAGYWRLGSGVADTHTQVPDEKDELVLGDELIVNGDFPSGLSDGETGYDNGDGTVDGWTVPNGWGVASVENGRLKITNQISQNGWGQYALTVVSGKSYLVAANLELGTNSTTTFSVSDTSSTLGSSTGEGAHRAVCTPSGTTMYIKVCQGGTGDGKYNYADNISVREITNVGNIGTTSGMDASNLALTGTVKDESDAAGYIAMDGTGDYIDIATPPDLGTQFSFEFVIKADSTGASDKIVDFGNGGRFVFEHNTSGTQVKPSNVGGWVTVQSPSTLADLSIHHLVLTINNTALTLYDNGTLAATATIAATDIDSCVDAKIGSYYASASDNFAGDIYRTSMWNRVLTASEVEQLNALGTHADPSKLFSRGLKLCYLMGKNEQDTTAKIYDVSGRGNHGTVTNAVVNLPANGTPNSISSVLKESPK